jgi:hypothetical protein
MDVRAAAPLSRKAEVCPLPHSRPRPVRVSRVIATMIEKGVVGTPQIEAATMWLREAVHASFTKRGEHHEIDRSRRLDGADDL